MAKFKEKAHTAAFQKTREELNEELREEVITKYRAEFVAELEGQ